VGVGLPLGGADAGHAGAPPICLTVLPQNPNNATFVFLTVGAPHDMVADFERVFELFDGRDDIAVSAARDRWKIYKETGHNLSYWRQDENGRWEKAG
ncbi:MAG: DNA polymerase III subunit chi, partial [Pseudomonadota bacterium]|nr:DNA polymerase III subunit chi [Pseudomonadota bacterium]